MKSMIEVVGRLQKAIELLESAPDKEASVIFAHQVLKDTESFLDFSLVKERRKRLQEFLDSLIALESEDDDDSEDEHLEHEIIEENYQNIWERRESFDGVNLYEEALRQKDAYDPLWMEENCYTEILCSNPIYWVLNRNMFDAVWMSCEILSDMLSYYADNCVNQCDDEIILQLLNVVEEILDGMPYGSADRKELVRLYEAALCFARRHCVSELRFDERCILPRKGFYNDEWLLDGALWQPHEENAISYVRRWRICENGKVIVSHNWPSENG